MKNKQSFIAALAVLAILARHGGRCLYALGGVFALQKLLCLAAGMLLLSTCSSPSGAGQEQGNITISIGGGEAREAWPFSEAYINTLSHTITVTDSSNNPQTENGIKYGSTVTFTVRYGPVSVYVEAFEPNNPEPVAVGNATETVSASVSTIPVQMRPANGGGDPCEDGHTGSYQDTGGFTVTVNADTDAHVISWTEARTCGVCGETETRAKASPASVTVPAASVIDLADGAGDIDYSAAGTVLIKGISSGRSVTLTTATVVYIANNTTILGSSNGFGDALEVPGGTTIYGGGSSIEITGGDVYENDSLSSAGIYANGDITISGTLGTISGGYSIFTTNGNIMILGTTGDISGIGAPNDNITISGTTGNIISLGGNGDGIWGRNITISGTTGNITGRSGDYNSGGYGNGISVSSLTISGTTGVISGGNDTGTFRNGGNGIYYDLESSPLTAGSITITADASIGNNTASSITGGTGNPDGYQFAYGGGTYSLTGHNDWDGERPYSWP